MELRVECRAILFPKFDFTGLDALFLKNILAVFRKILPPASIGNKTDKRFINQPPPLYSQQLGAGKIYLPYQSERIKGEITYWCKVI